MTVSTPAGSGGRDSNKCRKFPYKTFRPSQRYFALSATSFSRILSRSLNVLVKNSLEHSGIVKSGNTESPASLSPAARMKSGSYDRAAIQVINTYRYRRRHDTIEHVIKMEKAELRQAVRQISFPGDTDSECRICPVCQQFYSMHGQNSKCIFIFEFAKLIYASLHYFSNKGWMFIMKCQTMSYLRCDPFLIQICFSENARWSYMATTHHDSNNCQATDNLSRWLHCRFLSKKVCWEYGGFEDGGHPGSWRRAADFVNFFAWFLWPTGVWIRSVGPSSVRWCNSDRALESR